MARTEMHMERSGVGREQTVINKLKWKTAANYDTGTNPESWTCEKGEVKRMSLLSFF